MAYSQIPTSQTLPYYTEQVSLEGETFILVFKWNNRESAWYLSIYTADNTPIQVGRKIVSNWTLLRRVVSPTAPLGAIVAYDTTGQGDEPLFDTLGTQAILLYVDSDQLEIIRELV